LGFTLRQDMISSANEAKLEGQAIPTICAMCGPGPGCGIVALVRDGRFMGVEGMREAPTNQGRCCPKAYAAPQWVYSPERLKHPLKRVGARGEGKFQRIGWDEALEIIAGELAQQKEKFGPESLGILSPARRTYSDFLFRFLIAHGSPNYGHSGICAQQRGLSFRYTLGSVPVPDLARSNLIVIWGKQPAFSGAPMGHLRAILDAQARGAKVVAVKPSMEPDVALADVWLPIRPGTDAALALAMLHVVIDERLYDAEFVARWTYGFDQLKAHVQRYTPHWAARITGLPAEQIAQVARLYATTKPACIYNGNGLEHAPSCNDAVRAIASLMAISGNLDRPGGDLFPAGSSMPAPQSVHLRERYTQEWVDKLVGPEFPRPFQPAIEGTTSAYYRLCESVLTGKPYPIRALIAPGTQPTVSTRGSKHVMDALKKVDFFVVIDVMRTAEMAYADVVVPVATMYECNHPFEARDGWLMAHNRVIEPLGDYKSDYEFWLDLGVKMGYGADFWDGDIEACMNYQLEPFGMTMEELRRHPTGIVYQERPVVYERYEQVFSRRSPRLSKDPYLPQGKVALYNTTFEQHGFNPLPEWREPPEGPTATPELLDRYPLILSDYHTSKVFNASWLRNIPILREIQPYPALQIHPDTARARGIEDGDWVRVESLHGTMRMRAEIYPGIRPDTVMALHGWWQGCEQMDLSDFPLLDDGANTNNLYSVDPAKAYDPVVTAMSSQTLVQVTREP
jgi:anaerobic selenocysteine-containing dehydrogenase